jgi:hypothetical protein
MILRVDLVGAHAGGGNALAFKQPTWPYDIESAPGGLTREVETPLPSSSPHDHMILRVDLVGSHGRWKLGRFAECRHGTRTFAQCAPCQRSRLDSASAVEVTDVGVRGRKGGSERSPRSTYRSNRGFNRARPLKLEGCTRTCGGARHVRREHVHGGRVLGGLWRRRMELSVNPDSW